MKLKATKNIIDKNGYMVFTENHTYEVLLDKGNVLAVNCDLKAMYNIKKNDLKDFEIIDTIKG